MFLAMMTGLVSSSIAHRTPTATALAYGLVFAVVAATLLPLLARGQLSGPLRDWLFACNPFIASIQLLTTDLFVDLPELWRMNLVFALGAGLVFLAVACLRVRLMLRPANQ